MVIINEIKDLVRTHRKDYMDKLEFPNTVMSFAHTEHFQTVPCIEFSNVTALL